MKKTVVSVVVVALACCLALVAFLSLGDANGRNAALDANLVRLQVDYDSLQTKYYALLNNFSQVDYDYRSLLLQNPGYASNPLGSASVDTQQMLSRYAALQEMYVAMQKDYATYVKEYQDLQTLVNRRLLQGDLRYLVTPGNTEVERLVYNLTGLVGREVSAKPENYFKDIKAMYNWVNDNIVYREDGFYPSLPDKPGEVSYSGALKLTDQMAQMPNETLALRSGDCEDFAALLTSMLRAYFDNKLAECIWITGENAGHVAVVIPFDREQIVILDPIRDYYSHDTLGNIATNNISSEIYNWMQIWRPSLGNDVHVYRVFSDYVDKVFNGTQQYVDWMYDNRTA